MRTDKHLANSLKNNHSGGGFIHYYNWFIFGLFLLFGLYIYLSGVNHELFLAINHEHGLLPDQFWLLFNLFSYSKFFIIPLLLIIISYAKRRHQLPNVILLIVAYFVVFYVLKAAIGEARPYIVLPEGSFYWINLFENAVNSAYKSFPSGHTGNMAIFAFTLSTLFFVNKRGLQFIMLLLVILTGCARICTGWHWPLDVLASGLIGYLLVKACFAINLSRFGIRKS